MQCETVHRHDAHEDDHHERPKTEQECLDEFASGNDNIVHCPVEWDSITEICWPPSLAGTKASVPCPDKPDINTLHNACRQCLFNGTWYVNLEQNPKEAFTNYHDCFVFEEEEYRMHMEELIGKDTLLIHETLNDPDHTQYCLHGFSLLFLGVGLLIWFSMWLRKRQKSKIGKYKFMVMAYAVLIVLQGLCVLYSGMHYHTTLFTCYLFRVSHTLFESLLYTTILFYCLDTAMYVSGVSFSTIIRRSVNVMCLAAIIVITCLEGWIEIVLHPHDFCAFGVYLNPLHWLILWVKVSMNGGSFTLICVSLFGLCYLKIPPSAKPKAVRIMKQNISILLFWILFCMIWQFSPIFIYHMKKHEYSFDEIIYGTRVYAYIMASSGIVFSVVTCVLDIEILAFAIPVVQNYLNKDDYVPVLRVKVIKVDGNNLDDLKTFKVNRPYYSESLLLHAK